MLGVLLNEQAPRVRPSQFSSSQMKACSLLYHAQRRTWMSNGKEEGCDDDHGTFQDHERDLIVGQGSIKAITKLGDTETAADQNGQGCYTNR